MGYLCNLSLLPVISESILMATSASSLMWLPLFGRALPYWNVMTSCWGWDVNPTGTIHASFDSQWSVIPSGCLAGLERSAATRSERAFCFHLSPRTVDRSVQVVIPWCDLTIYCALSARQSLSADLSPCTGCNKLILLRLHDGRAAAVR